jgi:hypothetical protein
VASRAFAEFSLASKSKTCPSLDFLNFALIVEALRQSEYALIIYLRALSIGHMNSYLKIGFQFIEFICMLRNIWASYCIILSSSVAKPAYQGQSYSLPRHLLQDVRE